MTIPPDASALSPPAPNPLSVSAPLRDEIVVDRRILDLLHRYAQVSHGGLHQLRDDLLRIRLAPEDARFFGGRPEHVLALSISAMQQHPESELPVIGSAFWNSLLRAIQARGHRRAGGPLAPNALAPANAPSLQTEGASAELVIADREQRRLLRLSTRLTLAAGTTVEEDLVESDVIDLTTGSAVGAWIVESWAAPASGAADAAAQLSQTSRDVVPALIAGIEQRVAERLRALQQDADRSLTEELARIEKYYADVKRELREEKGPGTPGEAVIERERAKRVAEETRRFQLRVDVEPVQVEERLVLAERAAWRLTSPAGRTAELVAHRYLSGPGDWEIRCDCCRAAPAAVTVCRAAHVVGVECVRTCTVCNEAFCTEHGHAACVVDSQPVCDAHTDTCYSCERVHCTAHQATCTETGHVACSACVVACDHCARMICRKHGTRTVAEAPRGARLLCSNCITYCEGSTSEPVGVDECALCHTCGKHICERHQVVCAVDGQPHCSKHLRRADRSRRFICESHQAACARERGAIFASDEIRPCAQCGTAVCASHGAQCHEDRVWHCHEHAAALADVANAFACAQHQSRCHVDDRVFSLRGTAVCEICGRSACRAHRRTCDVCAADVCVKDYAAGSGRCVTCSKLRPTAEVPDEVLAAAMRLVSPGEVKRWEIARDGGRYVVDAYLGWTRHVVFTVPHGTGKAVRARRVSILGSTRIS